MERVVTDSEVAAYRGLAAQVARKYTGVAGAEFDDLEQEALIAIWNNLRWSFWGPSAVTVERACIDWVRLCGRKGYGGYDTLPEE
jgi:DNA-directed RNA polymerase specialized sigma24 family protein